MADILCGGLRGQTGIAQRCGDFGSHFGFAADIDKGFEPFVLRLLRSRLRRTGGTVGFLRLFGCHLLGSSADGGISLILRQARILCGFDGGIGGGLVGRPRLLLQPLIAVLLGFRALADGFGGLGLKLHRRLFGCGIVFFGGGHHLFGGTFVLFGHVAGGDF